MVSRSQESLRLLSASAIEDGHAALRRILRRAHWEVVSASSGQDAQSLLLTWACPVVICHVDFRDGAWKLWLRRTRQLPDAPQIIVSSQRGGGILWLEASGLGCYDILAWPYVDEEVLRVVSLAWSQWKRESQSRLAHSKPPASSPSPGAAESHKRLGRAS